MPKQTIASRRLMLKGIGAAGLAFSSKDVLAVLSFGPTAIQTQTPQRIGSNHPFVHSANQAAQNSELGDKRVPLKVDVSQAYFMALEYPLDPTQARKLGSKTVAVETVALPITDPNSVRALRERLASLNMSAAVRNRSVFYFFHAGRRGQVGRVSYVVGLAADSADLYTTFIRISKATRIPGWTLMKRPRPDKSQVQAQPRQAPSQTSGRKTPTQSSAVTFATSPSEAADELGQKVSCLLHCLGSMYEYLEQLYISEICLTCVVSLAALPGTLGVSSVVGVPACALCSFYLGTGLAACLSLMALGYACPQGL